jgi:uncharacterized damage-inducible protein DinB
LSTMRTLPDRSDLFSLWIPIISGKARDAVSFRVERADRPANCNQEIPMKTLLLLMILGTSTLHAQNEGLWEGYDGEWGHVSRQLIALAEATPPEKFSWRPAPGVRSTSEVYMHIAITNFYLLSVTGPPMPEDIKSNAMEKTVTSKPEVIAFLKRSLEAVQKARAQLKPGDLQRKVKIMNKDVTVDGMYLRIIVHDNEHMGQLIAYARMTGIVPPWSKAGPE